MTAAPAHPGAASGIVLSEDGYIITNRHCVINEDVSPERQFSRIDVTMYDGTVYENAEIVGTDSYTDLAVIKVDAAGLQPAEFGDSTALNLGDRVVALGNPGGLGWTPTQGIISGLTATYTRIPVMRLNACRPMQRSTPATRAVRC